MGMQAQTQLLIFKKQKPWKGLFLFLSHTAPPLQSLQPPHHHSTSPLHHTTPPRNKPADDANRHWRRELEDVRTPLSS